MEKFFTKLFKLVLFLFVMGGAVSAYAQCSTNQVMKLLPGADTSNCFGENNNYVKISISSWSSEDERDFTVKAATSMADLYVAGETLEQIEKHKWDATAKDIIEPAVFEMRNADVGKYYIWAVDDNGCEYDNDGDGTSDYLTIEIIEADSFQIEMELIEAPTCFEAIDGKIEITFPEVYSTSSEYVEFNDTVRHTRFRRTYYGLAETLEEAENMPTAAMTKLGSNDDNVVVVSVGFGTWYGGAYSYIVENRSELQEDGSWLDVIDENCISRTFTLDAIEVKGLDPVEIVDTAKMVSHNECYGENSGSIEVYPATGGSGNLVYTLQKDVDGTFVDVEDYVEVSGTLYTNLAKGTYIVKVTDLDGCEGAETDEIEVEGSDLFEFTAEVLQDISCAGSEDGMVRITVSGGATPYEYKIGEDDWQVMESETKDIVISEAGTYQVAVRDALECNIDEQEITIAEPSGIEVVAELTDKTSACNDVSDGEIKVVADGGNTDLFDINLILDDVTVATENNVDSVAVFSGLAVGSYTIEVYEVGDGAAGCMETATAEVEQADTISFDAVPSPNNLCFAEEKGKIVVSNIMGGTDQYTITISPEVGIQDSNVFTDLPVGWYEITVADMNGGCSTTVDSIQVTELQVLTLDVEQLTAYSCTENGSYQVTVSGGEEPYTISVNGETITESLLSLGKGTHVVEAVDANMCAADPVTITLEYVSSEVDSVEIYTGDTLQYINAEAGLDTMLTVGEYHFEYDIETNCTVELTVYVIGKEKVAPEVESMTPQDTIEDNHPVFVITFKGDITFNESGYLYVTAKDSSQASLKLLITDAMVDEENNTVTVTYINPQDGKLELNTTYIVTVDSGVIMGEGLAWDGVSDNSWIFTTGNENSTAIGDITMRDIEFKVYPNPFNDYIRIDNFDKLSRVVITNIAGQRVLDVEQPNYQIQTGNLVTGVYIVSLFTEDGIAKSERLIKR